MAAVELDVAQLATFCSVPQETITTLVDAPTADLVRTLLENISAKAREFNGLTSEKLRLGVELENAVRGAESKSRVLKSSIDKAHRNLQIYDRSSKQKVGIFKLCACRDLNFVCRNSKGGRGDGARESTKFYFAFDF